MGCVIHFISPTKTICMSKCCKNTLRLTQDQHNHISEVGDRPQRYEDFFFWYYGTVFLQNPSRPVFLVRYSLIFSYRDFFEIVRYFWYFFFGAISDQFRKFSQMLELLFIRKLPNKHFFLIKIKFEQ